jgi:nucleotide-binding universal stress UspA family protein
VVAELLAAAAHADLVALATASLELRRAGLGSTTRAMLASTTRALLILPPREAVRGAVAVVFDGTPRATQALMLAGQIAGATGPVSVLLLADDADEEQRLRREATRSLAVHGARGVYEWTVEVDAAQLARRLRAQGVGTLVLAEDCPGLGRVGVQALLRASDCAVLLLR